MTPQAPRVLVAASGSLASRQATAVAAILLIAGDPAPVIVALARDLGADLLAIGSTPRLLPSALTARTRRWVSSRAPCPVLPVSADQPSASRPANEPVLVT